MPHVLALLVLALALVSCAGYGGCWLRALGMEGRDRQPRGPLSLFYALALGMGTLGYLVLALGLAGFLTRPLLAGVLALGWIPAALMLRPRAKAAPGGGPEAESPPGEERAALFLWVFLALLGLVTLFSAFRPPDGLDWDSLSYHLAAPKIYLREGRIPFIAYDSHTHFPFAMEMLYTVGLAFGGASGGKLFHWASGWLTALALAAWTSRLETAGRRFPAWAGPLAAAAFISMPVVLWELGTAYVDLGTALFQFLALAALLEGVLLERTAPDGSVRAGGISPAHARVAGVLSGFALGTKYTALLQFGILGLGLLWLLVRVSGPARRAVWQATLWFAGLGLLVASPWYVKNWIWVHNPVYPFFYRFFPHSYSWTPVAEAAYAAEQRAFGLGRGPAAFVTSLWNLAMHGRAFYINERSLAGDNLGSIGPLWAGILPLALWTRGLDWKVRVCLLYAFGSVLLWFFLSQQVRYLIPVLAPLAVVLAAVVVHLPGRPLRLAAGAFLALALALNLGMHAPIAATSFRVAAGEVTEAEFLNASLPGLYEAAQFVNQLPEESRIALYQETRGFYFDRDYFWANPLQHDLIPYEEMSSGADLAAALRRFGITHVLVNYQFTRGLEGAKWYQLLMDAIGSGRLEEVFRSTGAETGRRGVIIYRLQ